MTLNQVFLGDNSVVDLVTKETVDQLKLKLASTYSHSRLDPMYRFPEEHEDFSTDYVYFIKKNEINIYFSKHINGKVKHNFHVNYPWFTGIIIDKGDSRLIKGSIGLPEYKFYFTLLWFGFFTFLYLVSGATTQLDEPQAIPLYVIFFGLLIFVIGLVGTRSKVGEMRDEIDRVFSNTPIK